MNRSQTQVQEKYGGVHSRKKQWWLRGLATNHPRCGDGVSSGQPLLLLKLSSPELLQLHSLKEDETKGLPNPRNPSPARPQSAAQSGGCKGLVTPTYATNSPGGHPGEPTTRQLGSPPHVTEGPTARMISRPCPQGRTSTLPPSDGMRIREGTREHQHR